MATMTQCPSCSKILKLKSDSAFGKKVPCPQCKEPFTVKPFKKKAKPAIEEPEDDDYGDSYDDDVDYGAYDDQAYDDYEDYGSGSDDQYDDYEPAPKRSSASKSSKKKSKKKKKAAGLPPWLMYAAFGLAGVLVVGGLVGTLVMAIGSSGGSNAFDLAWLPEDADLFVKVEPDELWNAPMLASVRENETVKAMMEQATQKGNLNVGMSDIESMTFAGVDMADMYQQRMNILGSHIGRPQLAKKADAKMVGVIRLKKDITPEDLGAGIQDNQQEYAGKTYYTSPDNQAMYQPDARTLIVGEADQVKKAIDRGPSEPRVSRIDFVNARHQLVVVMAPKKILDAEARSQVQSTAGVSSQQKFQTALDQNTKAFCFGLSLTSNIDMEIQLQCFSSSDATTLKTELDSMLTEMKTKYETSTGQTPPQFSEFVAIGRETIDSISAGKSGEEITVALSVPGRITTAVQDAIASNPLAGMMLQGMTQQFNQSAAQPAFGNPAAGSMNPAGIDPATGIDPTTGVDPAQAGLPPATNPEDFEAGVRQDQQNTLDTINGIRGQVKTTTGKIQDSVPGGK